ncbi:MAG TPA: ShlB/FhaC/HecB family hemolysin secretion/activation protein [Rariglobus sp.]|nr:ShlB/FhaC/HecB family hemolysin secretion/activation protein [Rariglobus sp.]
MVVLAYCYGAMALSAQEKTATAAPPADPGVPVDHFEFRYGLQHPALPAVEQLKDLTVNVTRDGNVFRAPAATGAENLSLSAIPEGSRFDGDALRGIAQDVVRWYNARGIFGVWVTFPELEISSTGLVDNRPADDHAARMVVWASQIAEIRTLARGKRFKPQASVNNRKHRAIAAHSPLKVGDLFREGRLNRYLRGLSLHPGRLVEASIASSGEPGKVVLDYLVNESRAWQVYGQVTNFGTESTGIWRGRIGFQDNQLTNHDDILNFDAITTPNLETYGSFLSYRIPVFRPAKLLARVYGSYGDFLASDAAIETLRYAGKNWQGGLEFSNRLQLPWNWELTSALGANFTHYGIQSRIIKAPLSTGSSNFLVPFFTGTLTRESSWWSLSGSARYEQTVGSFANLNTTNGIPQLGRLSADADWTSLRGSLNASMYLEPIFGGVAKAHHFAHEVSLRLRGRYLIKGKRLIPQEDEPMGGASSVRGYAEAVLAADEFYTASIEYALHFPRLFKPGPPGKFIRNAWPFQWRPARDKQGADWDLIGRVFYDYGYRYVNPVPGGTILAPGEELPLADTSLPLAGAGGGLELQLKQYFAVRCDVGVALNQLRDPSRDAGQQIVVPAGDVRYYISGSLSW